MEIELLQFPYSTFNEKARWALDYKRVSYSQRNLLPGPHALTVKRLTGSTTTPVVRFDSQVVNESAKIIDELERRFPDPQLYPTTEENRDEALRIQAWIDTDIGPRTRRCVLEKIIGDAQYTARLFGAGHSRLSRWLYAASFPLARSLIRKGNGIMGAESLVDGERALEEALHFVAARSRRTGYLVGDRFSVADLSAASILAAATNPPNSSMDRPLPRPTALETWTAHWAKHPGIAWVLEMYANHRHKGAA